MRQDRPWIIIENQFIALSDIAAGEILSQDLVEEKIAYTSQPSNSYYRR